MNRLKLPATATLMALTFTACDEGTPPPVEPPPPPTPVGTISGSVTIEGTAASGVTATLSSGATTTTGSGGNFAFSGVEAGTYTVTISGFPEDATFAQVTQSATIATDGQNVQLNFAGEYIRSSAVVGNVVAADAMMSGGDGQPETLVGVRVTLGGEHAMGETMETAEDGGFAFTGLRAGTYTVTISDFPEDVSFETVMVEVQVEVGEVGNADFTGHFIRTSKIEGQVIIDGEGLADFTVNLSGGPADEGYTTLTDADGMYSFEELRPGDYTVSITGFDPREYEFAAASQDVSVDLDETATVSFTGELLRTSGISGRVSVEGEGLGDVAVSLAGAAEATTTTDASGQYAFAGLAAGTYVVSIANPDDVAYVFDDTEATVVLEDDQSAIQNFDGDHMRTASISGRLFLDSNPNNDSYDTGSEDPLPHAGFGVALQGPGVGQVRTGATDSTGAFAFTELRAGTYRVVALITDEVTAALTASGLSFGGDPTGVVSTVAANGTGTVDIPIDIVRQTVAFQALMGNGKSGEAAMTGGPVEGVKVNVYANLNDADAIGSGMTDATGVAPVMFRRADDGDNVVFARVDAESLPSEHFALTGSETITVTYGSRRPSAEAGAPFTMVNREASIQFWVRRIETGRGGGENLNDWDAEYMMGGDTTAMAIGASGSDEDGAATEDGRVGPFTVVPDAADLPVTYTVMLADEQDEAEGQEYGATPVVSEGDMGMVDEDGTYLTYTHTGLNMSDEPADLGAYEVRFTTQNLIVGVHWERDHEEGFTGDALGQDKRPLVLANRGSGVEITLVHRNANGRYRTVRAEDLGLDCDDEVDAEHDFCETGNPRGTKGNSRGTSASQGLAVFENLPADMDFAVQFDAGSGRKVAGEDEYDTFRDWSDNDVGAFGEHGGTHPEVEICPLASEDGDCSTFAYVWAENIVQSFVGASDYDYDDEGSGTNHALTNASPNLTAVTALGARLADADGEGLPDMYASGLKVTLQSTSDLISYRKTATVGMPDDNGDDTAPGQFWFTDVPEGPYTVFVGSDDDWAGFSRPSSIGTLTYATDVSTSAVTFNDTLRVRSKNTSISGTVANDFSGGSTNTVQSNETTSGITVELYTRWTFGSLLGQPRTLVASETTNSRGEYTFEKVTEGTYLVVAKSADHFLAANNGRIGSKRNGPEVSTRITTVAPATTTVEANAAATEITLIRAYVGGNLPRWDYTTSKVVDDNGIELEDDGQASVSAAGNGSSNFVVLFKDGVAEGSVTRNDDGDVANGGRDDDNNRDPVVGATIRFDRCETTGGSGPDGTADANSGLSTDTCTATGDRATTTTDSNGDYRITGLMEGYWVVSVDRPAGLNYADPPGSQDAGDAVYRLQGKSAGITVDFWLNGPTN